MKASVSLMPQIYPKLLANKITFTYGTNVNVSSYKRARGHCPYSAKFKSLNFQHTETCSDRIINFEGVEWCLRS